MAHQRHALDSRLFLHGELQGGGDQLSTRAARFLGYALLFVALFLAGVWHGTTHNFVVFGLLNGVGAAVARMYGDGLRRLLGHKRFHAYLQNRLIRWVAVVLTLHFMCLSLLFFSTYYDQAMLALTTAWRQLLEIRTSAASHEWGPRGAVILVAATVLLAVLWKFDALNSLAAGIFSGAVPGGLRLFAPYCAR